MHTAIITTLITVLVIVPWSLLIGMSYLAYRRIRSQRARFNEMKKRTAEFMEQAKHPSAIESEKPTAVAPVESPEITQAKSRLEEAKKKIGFTLRDANHIAKMGNA